MDDESITIFFILALVCLLLSVTNYYNITVFGDISKKKITDFKGNRDGTVELYNDNISISTGLNDNLDQSTENILTINDEYATINIIGDKLSPLIFIDNQLNKGQSKFSSINSKTNINNKDTTVFTLDLESGTEGIGSIHNSIQLFTGSEKIDFNKRTLRNVLRTDNTGNLFSPSITVTNPIQGSGLVGIGPPDNTTTESGNFYLDEKEISINKVIRRYTLVSNNNYIINYEDYAITLKQNNIFYTSNNRTFYTNEYILPTPLRAGEIIRVIYDGFLFNPIAGNISSYTKNTDSDMDGLGQISTFAEQRFGSFISDSQGSNRLSLARNSVVNNNGRRAGWGSSQPLRDNIIGTALYSYNAINAAVNNPEISYFKSVNIIGSINTNNYKFGYEIQDQGKGIQYNYDSNCLSILSANNYITFSGTRLTFISVFEDDVYKWAVEGETPTDAICMIFPVSESTIDDAGASQYITIQQTKQQDLQQHQEENIKRYKAASGLGGAVTALKKVF